jgi:LPS sulfotransferase NodH
MVRIVPSSSYLVCATARSGSTLLCETLRATGVAGNPLEHFEVFRHSSQPRQPREYFEDLQQTEVLGLLAPLDPPKPDPETSAAWWARIVAQGTTSNGVWGGKLMWSHTEDLLLRARELPQVTEEADLDQVLTALFEDDLKLIFVTRPDKVAQAVSLWTAVQTQTWRAGQGRDSADAKYSFAGIHHLVTQLTEQDAQWRQWFAATGRSHFDVGFDALAAEPQATVGAVLEQIGLGDVDVPAPATRRQGDGRSAEWAARYRDETG